MSVFGENGINAPKVTLPPLNTNPRQWLDPEQIPPLIAAAVGTPSAFPVMLVLHSLRRSELLAVTWDDIDLADVTIRVSGAVVQNELHQFVTKETNKTATSTRTVLIMIPELRQALEAVPPEDRTGRLIPYAPHYIAELVNKACARAGVQEVGTHGLRHSFASLAYHLGMSELETMELGGWSDAGTMRKIYTHFTKMLAPMLAIDEKPLKNQCFCGSVAVFESPLGHQKEKTRNPNGSRIFLCFSMIPGLSGITKY